LKRDLFNIPHKISMNRRFVAASAATLIGVSLAYAFTGHASTSAHGAASSKATVYVTSAPRLPACDGREVIAYTLDGLRHQGADVAAVVAVAEDMRITAGEGHDVAAFCKAEAVLNGGARQPFTYQIGWNAEPGSAIYVVGDAIR
jgi:hypothetical protein